MRRGLGAVAVCAITSSVHSLALFHPAVSATEPIIEGITVRSVSERVRVLVVAYVYGVG
jgi:hypothetical protein